MSSTWHNKPTLNRIGAVVSADEFSPEKGSMKKACQALVMITISLCVVATTKADVVLETSFLAPGTSTGTYPTGSTVGSPNAFSVVQGSVAVISDPCLAAGGAAQCLQLIENAGTIPQLFSNKSLGPGTYDIVFLLAGGSQAANVTLGLEGIFAVPESLAANAPFSPYQFLNFQVPTGTSARLEIAGGGGALVNGVFVTSVDLGTAAPEPASGRLLLICCLFVLAICCLTRKSKQMS